MKLTTALLRFAYWPLCRRYARWIVGDKPADSLLKLLTALQFRMVHGFWPNLEHPQRFTEKLWCRMLYARDPILTVISDKLRVRDYVKARVGDSCLVPLLWSGEKATDIPFDDLPSRLVIKANHGAGFNVLVSDKTEVNRPQVIRQLQQWLESNFCEDTYLGIAWGYRNITPAILVEQFLEVGGKPPVDYKFYCFDGIVEFASLHFDRFAEHRTLAFDRSFAPYELHYDFPNWKGDCARPPNFDAMVCVAERLAADFNFMRVDLYSVADKIYFGELTPYPGGVSTKFLPSYRDLHLGSIWRGSPRTVARSGL